MSNQQSQADTPAESATSSTSQAALNPKSASSAESSSPPPASDAPPVLVSPPTPPAILPKPMPAAKDKESDRGSRGEREYTERRDNREPDNRDRGVRPKPGPFLKPQKINQCGNFKAGDAVTLPYSGQTVTLKSFYQGDSSGEWWATFEGGCVRLSALPESKSSE